MNNFDKFEKSVKDLRTICNRLDKFERGESYSKELWEILYKMEQEQYDYAKALEAKLDKEWKEKQERRKAKA